MSKGLLIICAVGIGIVTFADFCARKVPEGLSDAMNRRRISVDRDSRALEAKSVKK